MPIRLSLKVFLIIIFILSCIYNPTLLAATSDTDTLRPLSAACDSRFSRTAERIAISTTVKEAMARHFNANSTTADERCLIEFLARKGEGAIHEFVNLIVKDRGIAKEEFGNYTIPPFEGEFPPGGQTSAGVDGKLYDIPCTRGEFERERLELMAEIAVQRALGRKIVLAVGIGHVGTAMMCVTADAQINKGGKELAPARNRSTCFRRPLKGHVHPYFVLGYDLLAPFAASKIFLVNQGKAPIHTDDRTVEETITNARARGNMRATWLTGSLTIPDIVLIETAVHFRKVGKRLELCRAEIEPTVRLLHLLGSLVPKDALLLIESTTFPGFTQRVARPVIEEEFIKRGLLQEGESPDIAETAMIAYSPQVLQPGAQWLQSLREFPRQGSGITPEAANALFEYFSNVGFHFHIRPSTEWAEFSKIVDNAWYYGLLELMCAFMDAAERFGLDGFAIARAVAEARPEERGAMAEIAQMQVGGYCIPKDIGFMIEALAHHFNVSELELADMFKSRLIAATVSDYRAEAVLDSHLLRAFAKRGISFDDSCIGVLGIAYKGGIGDTRWTGSQRLVVKAAHYGATVECTDPYARTWPELHDLNPYDTTDWAQGYKNQLALRSMPISYQPEDGGFLDFINPWQDALVLATPHAQYFGRKHPEDRRTVVDSEGERTVYAGLDPVEVAARMLALEGRTIVDTYDYLCDDDIKTFLALGWDVRAMGKGHIDDLKDELTIKDKIAAARALLKELGRLNGLHNFRRAKRRGAKLEREWLEEAIDTTQKKLDYLVAESYNRRDTELLRARYEYARAVQELRFAKDNEKPAIQARASYYKHYGLLQRARLNKKATRSHLIQVRKFQTMYTNLERDKARRAIERQAEITIEPLRRKITPLMEQNAAAMTAMANTAAFRAGDKYLAPPAEDAGRTLQRILTSLKFLEEELERILVDLDKAYEELLSPEQKQQMLQELKRLRQERYRHLALSGRSVDISKMTEAESMRGWRIEIQKRVHEDPDQEKARIKELKNQGIFVIYEDTVVDENGLMLEFVPFTIYEQGPDGKLVKYEDEEGFSRARTIKWVEDANGGKHKFIDPLWSKFMLRVPLNLVDVEEAGFAPELYGNFEKLPLDMQQWFLREAFSKNKILSTMRGEPQSRFYLLMDANLDTLTAARGRGGILMDAETDTPVVITTGQGAEQLIMLKASGPYQAMDPAELGVDFSRTIQGGRVEHDLFTFRVAGTGRELATVEMYDGALVTVPLAEGCIVRIKEAETEWEYEIARIEDADRNDISNEFVVEKQSGLLIVKRKGGEEIGRLKMDIDEEIITEATLLGKYTICISNEGITGLVNNTTGEDMLKDVKMTHDIITRIDKTAMGQIPGHTREADPRSVLKQEGIPAYDRGMCSRAILRTVFRYAGRPDMEFQQLWRSVPSTRRIGWMPLGGDSDYDITQMTRTIGWNVAEILAQHVTCVHIAPNPDNIYSTGYFTDEDSQIPLYNERDPYGAFFKYFGYAMQLIYWDYANANTNNYDAVDLQHFSKWSNAFLDHLLEIRHGGRPLIRNPERFKQFREKARAVTKNDLRDFENDLMQAIWSQYLAHHVLRNRIERGYDPTMESTYSSSERRHRFNPNSRKKAARFIKNQRELLLAAKRLIGEEGYDPIYSRSVRFDFDKALAELDRKAEHIELLSAQPQRPNHYQDIYMLSFYPALKPNVYSVLDYQGLRDGKVKFRLAIAQALPTILREKADISLHDTLSSTETRVRDMLYRGLEQFPAHGDFPLPAAHFNAWFTGDGPAEITTLQDPEDVYRLLISDYMMSRQTVPSLSALGVINFQPEPLREADTLLISYSRDGVITYIIVDLISKTVEIREELPIEATHSQSDNRSHPATALGVKSGIKTLLFATAA